MQCGRTWLNSQSGPTFAVSSSEKLKIAEKMGNILYSLNQFIFGFWVNSA